MSTQSISNEQVIAAAKDIIIALDRCNYNDIERIAYGLIGTKAAVVFKIDAGVELSEADLSYIRTIIEGNEQE